MPKSLIFDLYKRKYLSISRRRFSGPWDELLISLSKHVTYRKQLLGLGNCYHCVTAFGGKLGLLHNLATDVLKFYLRGMFWIGLDLFNDGTHPWDILAVLHK